MTFAVEIAVRGAPSPRSEAWIERDFRAGGGRLPGALTADLYRPTEGAGADPYVDDGPGPIALLMADFRDAAAAARALVELGGALAAAPAGLSYTSTGLQRVAFPLEPGGAPPPLVAPFSYVVRYHRPAEDEAAFVRNYVETHPPLLAQLPAIRNVMCYLPDPWSDPNGLAPADYMLGNEVVFDDAQAFAAAMASPIRHELRAHWRTFPRFTGANTHYPMRRERLIPSGSAAGRDLGA
jgi:uncharacterized protein (TIGR02118 family)